MTMEQGTNLSNSVIKEYSQRTTTLTDNQKIDYENEGSSMHENSCFGINFAHMFPKCFRSLHIVWIFRSVLHVVNSIVVVVTIYSIFDLYENSL